MHNIKTLQSQFPNSGKVEWISLRPIKKEIEIVQKIEVNTAEGIIGDHYKGRSGKRHITLIQAEHLLVVAHLLKLEKIEPALLRRNLVVSGLNLLALKGQRFAIGSDIKSQCILEGTGPCHPCSRMEDLLGKGGYNAMRGHGGITAMVIQDGNIEINDFITVI
ncbi:MAG: MOSC domain-containing protein YiiM [Limisphaerales bacterium]|jgi:MOSC domain-containing protein YiiM